MALRGTKMDFSPDPSLQRASDYRRGASQRRAQCDSMAALAKAHFEVSFNHFVFCKDHFRASLERERAMEVTSGVTKTLKLRVR
jgi:hypothetical protein